jgi:pilus assembly protein CpaB
MNRRNRTILVLVLAVVLAAGASYAVYRTVSNLPVREVEVATMQVAVATEDLDVGTRVEKQHVKMIGWPAASPVQGSFNSIDAVVGRGLIQPIAANEPLTESKLASLEAGAGLPPTIPPGMRAMSVKVNEIIGVAGFTVPGTRVDVLVTLSDTGGQLSRVVLSNVQVLTAGTRFDQAQAKDGRPMPTSVVTLLLTPEDAERVTLSNMPCNHTKL